MDYPFTVAEGPTAGQSYAKLWPRNTAEIEKIVATAKDLGRTDIVSRPHTKEEGQQTRLYKDRVPEGTDVDKLFGGYTSEAARGEHVARVQLAREAKEMVNKQAVEHHSGKEVAVPKASAEQTANDRYLKSQVATAIDVTTARASGNRFVADNAQGFELSKVATPGNTAKPSDFLRAELSNELRERRVESLKLVDGKSLMQVSTTTDVRIKELSDAERSARRDAVMTAQRGQGRTEVMKLDAQDLKVAAQMSGMADGKTPGLSPELTGTLIRLQEGRGVIRAEIEHRGLAVSKERAVEMVQKPAGFEAGLPAAGVAERKSVAKDGLAPMLDRAVAAAKEPVTAPAVDAAPMTRPRRVGAAAAAAASRGIE